MFLRVPELLQNDGAALEPIGKLYFHFLFTIFITFFYYIFTLFHPENTGDVETFKFKSEQTFQKSLER